MIKNGYCINCLYFSADTAPDTTKPTGWGNCHRKAPIVLSTAYNPFAQAKAYDWCGEFKPLVDEATLGVGDGDGSLFVHGSYEAIKACQRLILQAETNGHCHTCKYWGSSTDAGDNKRECQRNNGFTDLFDYLDYPPLFYANFGCIYWEYKEVSNV